MAEEHAPPPVPVGIGSVVPAPATAEGGTPTETEPASSRSHLLSTLTLGLFGRPRDDTQAPPNYVSRIDGTREVVETVVFVVVLVLLLKSFVAEAFVIPTGSMATTLWGYQKHVACEQCGYEFPVNCSQEVEPQEPHLRQVVTSCLCPNCRWHNKLVKEVEQRDSRTGQRVTVTQPGPHFPANTGDRVLVAKFLYDLPWKKPERLDVVVFKYPREPQKTYVPMNYIKRLIGLGGETIAIHNGDIYVLDAARSPKYDDSTVKPTDLWQRENMHENSEPALRLFQDGQFQVLRKPPDQVLSMRRIVHDNDRPAKDLPQLERWSGQGGWAPVSGARSFQHAPKSEAKETSWLRYRHLLRTTDGKPSLITDFMGYNTANGQVPPQHWVGDLIVEAEVKVEKPEGSFALELSRGTARFRAVWDLATGECRLLHLGDEWRVLQREKGEIVPDTDLTAGKLLTTSATRMRSPGTYRVRLANVDNRLIVWVDKELPFGDGVVYTQPAEPGPTKENDLEPASVAADRATLQVSHLTLWRDTYYTYGDGEGEVGEVDWADPSSWGRLRSLPTKTLYVQPGHYLCMGDNSPQSSDSRSWGLVPERLMLGRALAVYYPFYFPWWPFNSPVNRVGPIE